jgi:hypothetical protein
VHLSQCHLLVSLAQGRGASLKALPQCGKPFIPSVFHDGSGFDCDPTGDGSLLCRPYKPRSESDSYSYAVAHICIWLVACNKKEQKR